LCLVVQKPLVKIIIRIERFFWVGGVREGLPNEARWWPRCSAGRK